jgi:hypothetical protein
MSTTTERKSRPMTMVPVTTMEEMPLPSEAERAEMIVTLQQAEAEIAAGKFIVHEPARFVDEMLGLRAQAKPAKTV